METDPERGTQYKRHVKPQEGILQMEAMLKLMGKIKVSGTPSGTHVKGFLI
jgi:hypothetical protein